MLGVFLKQLKLEYIIMYKNNLPNVKTYYHHIKITYNNNNNKKMYAQSPEPQSMNLSADYFVNPKYLDL